MEITPLSKREQDVLELVADGRVYTWIAEELCISVHTVKCHVKNIHRKLNASTNAKAVAVGFRNGLLQ